MKATTFKLFATMITLAAVTTITTIPANAQRRSTQQSKEIREPERNRNTKSAVKKTSTSRNYDRNRNTPVNRQLNKTRSFDQKSKAVTSRNSKSQSKKSTNSYSGKSARMQTTQRNNSGNWDRNRTTNTRNKAVQPKTYEARNTKSSASRQATSRTSNPGWDEKRNTNSRMANATNSIRNRSENKTYARNTNGKKLETNRSSSRTANNGKAINKKPTHYNNDVRRSTGTRVSNTRDFYRVDESDKRYRPNNNYKGSKKYWSNNHRPKNMNYNYNNKHNYKHYKYNKHKHWNRGWERYRWNYNSWCDYYNGYYPRSYVYHKHYYKHYHYGHVIRRFDYRPQVFVHNHHNYYSYNGHFFRYRYGVGYVLVDVPFGLTVEYLPRGYEQVYINGYLYFRVGNLFFETAGYGFRLVHYPERYYANNDNYYSQGYYFDDYNYYN